MTEWHPMMWALDATYHFWTISSPRVDDEVEWSWGSAQRALLSCPWCPRCYQTHIEVTHWWSHDKTRVNWYIHLLIAHLEEWCLELHDADIGKELVEEDLAIISRFSTCVTVFCCDLDVFDLHSFSSLSHCWSTWFTHRSKIRKELTMNFWTLSVELEPISHMLRYYKWVTASLRDSNKPHHVMELCIWRNVWRHSRWTSPWPIWKWLEFTFWENEPIALVESLHDHWNAERWWSTCIDRLDAMTRIETIFLEVHLA